MPNTCVSGLLLVSMLCLPGENDILPVSRTTAIKTWQQEMLDQVNDIRKNGCTCGRQYMAPVKPVTWNEKLASAALAHAKDMEKNVFMGHRGSNGSRIGQRVDRSGYRWTRVAENVSWNYESVRETVSGWKRSPGHCQNMMGNYDEMGAAHAGAYYVQVFASQ